MGERADPPMLAESTNEDGEVVIRRTRRHERVDLCEDADGDGSDDKDAAEDEDAADDDDGDYEE